MFKRIDKIILLIIVLITTLGASFNWLYSPDNFLTDFCYNRARVIPDDIVIIGIDEETVNEWGNFTNWSRVKTAELIEYLYEDKENSPAVVGVDLMFVDEMDATVDEKLATAAAKGDVVFATNTVYRTKYEHDEAGKYTYDTRNIEFIEEPYDSLKAVSTLGFSNASLSKDGVVRTSLTSVDFNNEKKYSFSHEIYRLYQKARGLLVDEPKVDGLNQFQFFYTGNPGEFQHFSWLDVAQEKIPKSIFKDKIVIIGAWAPGFQDAYHTAINRGKVMYGCEVHANIVEAYLNGLTAVPVNHILMTIITSCLLVLIVFLGKKCRLAIFTGLSVITLVGYDVSGILLAQNGYVIPLIYVNIGVLLVLIYYIVEKYVIVRIEKKRTLEVFKKYVAPQVVEDILKSKELKIELGGELRNVAVLFVDVRGFTPMSEGMPPQEVVSVLNEYLHLTTHAILQHKGTLDKFIGDATMAVFNAPFDQEDYIYEAVATAWDIKAGSIELEKRLQEKYGKAISVGIGINCGEAVVGNIGCDFRMDYTAIGDTVNTAARLESNAKQSEILISEAVYRELKDRIQVEEVGEIPLKGKSNRFTVYRVIGI